MSNIKPWKEISRDSILYKYGRGLDKVIFEMPDGTQIDFYLKNEQKTVGILALTEDNKVILARQYRPGPNLILDEIPGGHIDDGETPEEAAKRELLEETGYAGEVEVFASFHDDAYSNRVNYAAIALNCKKVAEPIKTSSENVDVVIVPLKNLRKDLKKSERTDTAVAYMALDYLKLL